MVFILSVIITFLIMKHIIIPFANKLSKDEDCKDDWVYSRISTDIFSTDWWD